ERSSADLGGPVEAELVGVLDGEAGEGGYAGLWRHRLRRLDGLLDQLRGPREVAGAPVAGEVVRRPDLNLGVPGLLRGRDGEPEVRARGLERPDREVGPSAARQDLPHRALAAVEPQLSDRLEGGRVLLNGLGHRVD